LPSGLTPQIPIWTRWLPSLIPNQIKFWMLQMRNGTRVNGAADVALAYDSVMDVTAGNHERQRLQHSEHILAEYMKHALLAADQVPLTLSPATVAMRVHVQPGPEVLGHWLAPSIPQPITRIDGGRGDDHYWIKAGDGTVYIQDIAVETYIVHETR
jgi:hypothetical protein